MTDEATITQEDEAPPEALSPSESAQIVTEKLKASGINPTLVVSSVFGAPVATGLEPERASREASGFFADDSP